MKLTLPLYQHPTLVILVDDSASFIASLEFQMHPLLAVKTFDGSVEALRWIFSAFRQCEEGQEGSPTRPAGLPAVHEAHEDGNFTTPDISHIYRTVLDPRR